MNKHIHLLHEIVSKKSRRIIGLMSGTSLDGLDIALCQISGHGSSTLINVEYFTTVLYSEEFKTNVRTVFSKSMVDLQKLCLLNEWIGSTHASMVNEKLKEWEVDPSTVDLIASHGQTVYHAPKELHRNEKFGNGTLQIGDGDHLAVQTGIITISDFRQKHIAAGGEGAPLASYGDFLIFQDLTDDVVLLNIGGIANFSFIPPAGTELPIYSADTGPGNTLMDAWVQKHFPGLSFDEDASIAKKGKVSGSLLSALKSHEYFNISTAKTTGPELFNLSYLEDALSTIKEKLSAEDVMATLNRFTAETIADAINFSIKRPGKTKIYASGGGAHNPLLMQFLETNIKGVEWRSTTEKNIDPDAKEAVLFALLANECVAGQLESYPAAVKNFPRISMGKISFPA